jgi:hypothetical protein
MRRTAAFPTRRCGSASSAAVERRLMSEWWTYRLTSFLLFSPRTYYRTIELYNMAIWPAQLVGLAIGLAIVRVAGEEAAASRSNRCRAAGRLLVVGRMGVPLPALCADQLGSAVGLRRHSRSRGCCSPGIGAGAGRIAFRAGRRRAFRFAIALIVIIVLVVPVAGAVNGAVVGDAPR